MEMNTAYTGQAVEMQEYDVEEAGADDVRFRNSCSEFGICISVSPWVPMLGAVMIGIALPVWVIYTRRALAVTAALSDGLLGTRTYAVGQMAGSMYYATLAGVVAIASLAGLCVLASWLRAYQEAAAHPDGPFGPVSRISLGSYVALTSLINFGMWAMSIAVALLIATQLSWLLLAFMMESALARGVRLNASGVVEKATGELCPASCMNLGSFYVFFQAATPCLCSGPEQHAALLGLATAAWKALVHALAALALMGLASLWLAMNLSAQFAHARRDLRSLRARRATHFGPGDGGQHALSMADPQLAPAYHISEAGAVAQVTTTHGRNSGKLRSTSSRKDTRASHADKAPSQAAVYRTSTRDVLPDSLVNAAPSPEPSPAAAAAAAASSCPARGATPARSAAVATAATLDALAHEELAQLEAEAAAALALSAATAATTAAPPAGSAAASGCPAGVGGAAGGSTLARRETLNTTAQRYAAYRLRTAQTIVSTSSNPAAERKWSR